jgi:DNA processing protein
LVDAADDVLLELKWAAAPAATPQLAAAAGRDDDALLAALGHDPVTLDALLARTGEPAPGTQRPPARTRTRGPGRPPAGRALPAPRARLKFAAV